VLFSNDGDICKHRFDCDAFDCDAFDCDAFDCDATNRIPGRREGCMDGYDHNTISC